MTIFNLYKHNIKRAPENEGGAAAAATADNTDNPATATTENVLDVLHFDPFKKGDEIPPATAGGKTDDASSGEGNEGGEASTPPAKAPETKPAASATPAQNDDQAKHWENLANHYKELAEGNKGAKVESKEETKPKTPEYAFNIPDELIGALTGDDPVKFKQGLTGFAVGIARAVHAQMQAQLEASFNPRFEQMPVMIQAVLKNQEYNKTVHDDFYGKYPELNHPNLHQLIKNTGETVAKELGKKAWDTQLRDETAKKVKEILAVATAAANGGKAATKAPAKMLGSQGSRPTPPANDDARDIVDTLFGTDN